MELLQAPKLDSEANWQLWSQHLDSYLRHIKAHEITIGDLTIENAELLKGLYTTTYTDPNNIFQIEDEDKLLTEKKAKMEYERRDNLALVYIKSSTSPTIFGLIHQTESSKEAYILLKVRYEGPAKTSAQAKLRKLTTTKFPFGEDLDIFFYQLKYTWSQVKGIPSMKDLPDEILTNTIHTAMPSEFRGILTYLEEQPIYDNPEALMLRLLNIYPTLKEDKETKEDNIYFTKPQSTRKDNFPCKICTDHYKRIANSHKTNECRRNYAIENKQKNNIKTNNYFTEKDISCQHSPKNQVAILDGGASTHVSGLRDYFQDFEEIPPHPIQTSNGTTFATGKGTLKITTQTLDGIHNWSLSNTFYIPNLDLTLISCALMAKPNYTIVHKPRSRYADICNSKGQTIARIAQIDRKLIMNILLNENAHHISTYSITRSSKSLILWHERMGHMNEKDLRILLKQTYGITFPRKDKINCEICKISKSTQQPFNGTLPTATSRGYKYIITFIDEYTRYSVVYPITEKYKALESFKHFKNIHENLTGFKIKFFHTDKGGEYTSIDFKCYLRENGITQRLTAGYSPPSNGIAERYNKTLMEGTRAMLFKSGLPKRYWIYAITYQNHIRNKSPHHSKKNKTPFELFFGRKPDLKNIRVFGCRATIHIPSEKRDKLDPTAKSGIFLGFPNNADGAFALVDGQNFPIIHGRNISFNEDILPGISNITPTPARPTEHEQEFIHMPTSNTVQTTLPTPPVPVEEKLDNQIQEIPRVRIGVATTNGRSTQIYQTQQDS